MKGRVAGSPALRYRAAALLACCALLGPPRDAAGLSLFPARDPVRLLEEIDTVPPARELRVSCWQPYGLTGVAVSDLESGFAWRGLACAAAYEQQDWTVIAARSLRLRLVGGEGALRLGCELRSDAIVDGAARRRLEVLAAGGGGLRIAFRYRFWEAPVSPPGALDPAGLLGLAWSEGAWTLRVFRNLGTNEDGGEGLALTWREQGFSLSAISGAGPWQTLELAYRRGCFVLACRARLHDWLGVSRGLSFRVD